jgi:hypothetical protein
MKIRYELLKEKLTSRIRQEDKNNFIQNNLFSYI